MADERLITPQRVAEILGISKRTLWRLRSSRKIPEPVRLGNVVRWDVDEIDNWIRLGCPAPKKAK